MLEERAMLAGETQPDQHRFIQHGPLQYGLEQADPALLRLCALRLLLGFLRRLGELGRGRANDQEGK